MREHAECPCRERRIFGGLQNRGVAAQQRRKRLPRDVGYRRVRRDDETRNAKRLADDHRALVRHRAGRRLPVETAALAGDEEAHLDRGIGLPERILAGLTCFPRDEIRDRRTMLLHQDGDPAENLAPLDHGRGRPCRLRLARPLDRRAHVGGGGPGDLADLAARGRVDLREQPSLRGQRHLCRQSDSG